MELSRRRIGAERGKAGRLRRRNRAPGGNKGGLIGQAVIKQDRELLSLKRMERSVLLLRLGPPAKRSARETTGAQPIAMAIVAKDPEGGAAAVSEHIAEQSGS